MYRFVKRSFDILSASMLLLVISPLFVLLMILVRCKIGYPIFFHQERSGKNMRPFNLIKFRTMTDERDERGELLPDHIRLTEFGRFLRSTSLDELPELINIIRGDMSVIGPRPLPMKYNPYYKNSELARFNVRGGLITPDSLDASPTISWDRQFEYEADYGKNLSAKKDCEIFFAVFGMLKKRNSSDYGAVERKSLIDERSNHYDEWNENHYKF